MPSSRVLRVPSYRRHKPTGQAVVTLNGKDHYLGRWNTVARCRVNSAGARKPSGIGNLCGEKPRISGRDYAKDRMIIFNLSVILIKKQ
jgi:hypothetical protein